MKHLGIIGCGWIIWLILWSSLVLPSITENEIKEKENEINGNYLSDDMINISYRNLYEAQNIEISFIDGKYKSDYDLYSKCTQYYEGTKTCYDNQKQFIKHYSEEGTYTIEDDKLYLYLDSDEIGTTCKLKNNYSDGYNIDCTDVGGWLYKRVEDN